MCSTGSKQLLVCCTLGGFGAAGKMVQQLADDVVLRLNDSAKLGQLLEHCFGEFLGCRFVHKT
jgi:hypothetical protein